jgi:hypothetical protein
VYYHTAFDDAVSDSIIGTPHVRNSTIFFVTYEIKIYEIRETFLYTVSCECGVSLEGS